MKVEQMEVPTLEDIRLTSDRNRPFIIETPIHEWRGREIDGLTGPATKVVVKLELFQHSGTFKARGAITNMMALDSEALKRGVTAVSAGNHAIATSYAASRLGSPAKVVMLASADPARVQRAEAYGAEVLMAPTGPEAFALAEKIAATEGRTFIHPFEGPNVTLGTGTLGLEFNQQAGPLDAIIVPIGGGGLCSGVSLATKLINPACRVYGVEPEGADTMRRSLEAGSPQSLEKVATIADSLAPPYALPYSFALCRDNVDKLVLVDDDAIRRAMAVLFRELKLALEPAAAVATAALIGPLRDELAGKRVGIIICGANIALDRFCGHVEQGIAQTGLE
ncbi:threonine ammonia-lyase [Sphingosinicella rhizophila]|uniref:Threonine/serine dehydratase n=1 Tax=Sphingosinicella rhizophila TaxID=3050082 RepID=A0ABU3QAM6_9SPHN|nr:threonine/serine dehydratase [Sphingosinicella sp. GR2756]MDT9600347.1 threonine/serine dehydratase [Sphingosinicella sp. GR2756]